MIPEISVSVLGAKPGAPVLVLGPSLGTSASTIWRAAAELLADDFDVLAWDLPGHGANRAVPDSEVSMAELAGGVLAAVDRVLGARPGEGIFTYAGDSIGGAVGLQLLLDAPERVSSAVLLCTGAKFGDGDWHERVERVRRLGTAGLVASSAERWFGPGFLEREPNRGADLLHALEDADDRGYAQVCATIAAFDVRDRLGEIRQPVLAVAGSHDVAAPPDKLREVATGVQKGRYAELHGVAHLAPAEAPDTVAQLIRGHALASGAGSPASTYDAGLAVRREVLGREYVDVAQASTTELTREFQELITSYAWGSIWTRPGLDRRSRSVITLTALIARGHHEELALHLQAARTNGLTVDEIKEVLLQTAIYCGVPDANTAFRIAKRVFEEDA